MKTNTRGRLESRPYENRTRLSCRGGSRAALCSLLFFLFQPAAFAQTANSVSVNRLGSAGAAISIITGASVELLPGNTNRLSYCTVCTVPVNCTWTDPSAADAGPAVTPSSSVGYPLAASTNYCEDPRTFGVASVRSRMDCISTSGSGTCTTREEQ